MARPILRSTLPLLCTHLDFYLPFFPPCTQLCPCPVLILPPGLYPATVCFALPSNISLLCHPHTLLFPSLFHYPALSTTLALSPSLPSTMTCPYVPFAMPFQPSDLSYLMPSTLPVAMF